MRISVNAQSEFQASQGYIFDLDSKEGEGGLDLEKKGLAKLVVLLPTLIQRNPSAQKLYRCSPWWPHRALTPILQIAPR